MCEIAFRIPSPEDDIRAGWGERNATMTTARRGVFSLCMLAVGPFAAIAQTLAPGARLHAGPLIHRWTGRNPLKHVLMKSD